MVAASCASALHHLCVLGAPEQLVLSLCCAPFLLIAVGCAHYLPVCPALNYSTHFSLCGSVCLVAVSWDVFVQLW